MGGGLLFPEYQFSGNQQVKLPLRTGPVFPAPSVRSTRTQTSLTDGAAYCDQMGSVLRAVVKPFKMIHRHGDR